MITSIPIPQRVLVIGGGPTGLVALRNLLERGKFEHVELWERRDDIGGVWYLDEPIPTSSGSDSDTLSGDIKPKWPSPAYKGLIGNVLPEFLSFSEFPFPEPPTTPHQPFPTLVETHAYLRAFSEPHLKDGRIKLNREVVSVSECQPEDGGFGEGWQVTFRDWNGEIQGTRREVEEFWDAVVIATGLWDSPVWPDTEGLEELKNIGMAKHGKWYRGPEVFEGKKSLVIGNANSSNEMAAQLCAVSNGPVYQSVRRPAFSVHQSLASKRIKMVPPVSKYIPKGSEKFDAILTDGTILTDLDYVHCGTGYRPLPCFIHVLDKSDDKGKHKPFTSKDVVPWRIPYLHRLVLYAYNPSLAFTGAGRFYTPFIIADLVSTWLALAWRGEVTYPDTPEERLIFERERLALIAKRRGKMDDPSSLLAYHMMTLDEQEYASEFRREIVKVRPELDKVLPVWSDEKMEERKVMLTKTKYFALEYARDHPDHCH